jgi:predicted component of type VI protein secretion system
MIQVCSNNPLKSAPEASAALKVLLQPPMQGFISLMPAHRRAKLWELYLEHSPALKDEPQNDLGRLFGQAFLEAYNAQVKSLQAAPDEMGGPVALRPAAPTVG